MRIPTTKWKSRHGHAIVPDSGPTVASRTCMVVGKILERAASAAREDWLSVAGRILQQARAAARGKNARAAHVAKWDRELYRDDAYATYAWACDMPK